MPLPNLGKQAIPVLAADPYPMGATVVTAGVVVATGTSSQASLPAVAAKTNYISGFQVTYAGGASTAAPLVTVSGIAGSTMVYQVAVPGTTNANVSQLAVSYAMPIPATGQNTAITVSLAAGGASAGNGTISVQGFTL